MVSNFTEEQIADFKCAFEAFDEDNNGRITADELETVLNNLGMAKSKEEVLEIIKQIDTDENGTIDFQEFTAMLTKKMKRGASMGIMKEAFKEFDLDGDGFISAEEFKKFLGGPEENISDEEVAMVIKEVDKDGDGRVNYEEFIKMYLGM